MVRRTVTAGQPVEDGADEAELAYPSSLAADDGVELEDGVVLLGGEGPALDVRSQVVSPPEPAALAAPV